MAREEGKLILQGVQLGLGWSMVIPKGPSHRQNNERFYTAWVNLRHSKPRPECPKLGDKRTWRGGGRNFRS